MNIHEERFKEFSAQMQQVLRSHVLGKVSFIEIIELKIYQRSYYNLPNSAF